MMIYLVRHGESELNAKRIHQDGKVGLSKKGVQQAHQLAERFSSIPVDTLITSPFERAKQTAGIISEKINVPVELNPFLVEIKRPTEIEGRGVDEPEVMAIKTTILENWENSEFRHSDEETFFEFKERAKKVIEGISTLDKEHVLIVTHGDLIAMIVCLLAFGDNLKPQEFLSLRKLFSLSHTGITVCRYEENKWKLLTWNDVTHIPA